jgi:2-methylcitrate dehydratase PrpD
MEGNKLTISSELARFSYETSFSQVPPEVLQKAKLMVLDTFGVCLSSSQFEFGRDTIKLAEEWETQGGVSLIGSSLKVAPHHAALVNGILGHGQDYDDTHAESVVHPSSALVPAMLACAERDHVDGKRALLALVVAIEVSIRLAMPALNKFHLRGFHTTSVACTFGAALLSSRTRNDSLEACVEALGICGSFASGLLECVPARSSAKRLHAGWAGLCGIMASDFAKTGFTGPTSVIEGSLGLYNSILRGEQYDLGNILDGIGQDWEILNTRAKLYPCCHYLQSFIECAATLRRSENFSVDNIVSIDCQVTAGAVNMICKPWDLKIAPVTGYDARFSLPYAICIMLYKGKAGAEEFEANEWTHEPLRDLMSKVSYKVNPNYSVKDMPGSVKITMSDGRVLGYEMAKVRGDREQPFAEGEIIEKFLGCTEHLGKNHAERLVDVVLSMETLEDVGNLVGAGAS